MYTPNTASAVLMMYLLGFRQSCQGSVSQIDSDRKAAGLIGGYNDTNATQNRAYQNSTSIATRYEKYQKKTYFQIETELENLALQYPNFTTLFTSQDRYGLPSACRPFENLGDHDGCENTVLVIEDAKSYESKKGIVAKREVPHVLLSGELHGNERIGPVAVLETAKLLLQAVACEGGIPSSDCNSFETKHGTVVRGWLARLVSTRRIVIVPTANARGYAEGRREERYVNNSK